MKDLEEELKKTNKSPEGRGIIKMIITDIKVYLYQKEIPFLTTQEIAGFKLIF